MFTREKVNGGYIVTWKTNDDSFRGDSLAKDPPHRIIVYGDSNIQARFSGKTRTFPWQLSFYLSKNDIRDVEVINAGVLGFGPDQMLIRFSKEVDKYKPDLVIFNVFADNDFGDIIRNRLFDLDEDGNLVDTDHENTIDEHLLVSKLEKLKKFISNLLTYRALEKIAFSFSKLITKSDDDANEQLDEQYEQMKEDIINQLLQLVEAEFLEYKNSRPRKYSHFADHYDIDVALHPNRESSKIKLRLMEGVLNKASALANSKGVSFLVLIQPSVMDLTKDNILIGYKYLQKYPNYKRTNLSKAVEKICSLHGIHSINLFSAFIENDPEDLYFRGGNGHWTDRGQQIAAKEVAQYIIDYSMIKS